MLAMRRGMLRKIRGAGVWGWQRQALEVVGLMVVARKKFQVPAADATWAAGARTQATVARHRCLLWSAEVFPALEFVCYTPRSTTWKLFCQLPQPCCISLLHSRLSTETSQSWLKAQEVSTARRMRGWSFPPPRRSRSTLHSSPCRSKVPSDDLDLPVHC